MINQKMSGFTLIEMLVAMLIVAILSVMAASMMAFALRAQSVQEAHQKRLAEWQWAYVMMQNDFEQMIDRPVWNADRILEASFIGLNARASDKSVIFTRGGVANPLWEARRSGMMRVAYGVVDNRLIRYIWPVLDQFTEIAPLERVILEGVGSLSWQFVNGEGVLFDQWLMPMPAQMNEEGRIETDMMMSEIPRGVWVEWDDLKNGGHLSWLFTSKTFESPARDAGLDDE